MTKVEVTRKPMKSPPKPVLEDDAIGKLFGARRALTTTERQRKAKKKGGFDDSYIDKNFIKRANGNFYYCRWCGKPMYVADFSRLKGEVKMSCTTDECIGNIDMSDLWRQAKLKQLGLTGKLAMNTKKLIHGKQTNQIWINEKGRF